MLANTWEEPLALWKALEISTAAGRHSDGCLSAMELYMGALLGNTQLLILRQ